MGLTKTRRDPPDGGWCACAFVRIGGGGGLEPLVLLSLLSYGS